MVKNLINGIKMVPIPKDTGTTEAENFRAIT